MVVRPGSRASGTVASKQNARNGGDETDAGPWACRLWGGQNRCWRDTRKDAGCLALDLLLGTSHRGGDRNVGQTGGGSVLNGR